MKKETLIKFYQKYKLVIFPMVVTLSSLILIVFVIYPQTAKLISGSRQEAEFREKSKFLEAKAEALENFDEADLSRKVDYALSSLPSDKDPGNIIGLLQGLASETSFSITSLTLSQKTTEKDETQSYLVNLQVLGPKALVPILVTSIENSARIMKVNTIEISTTRDANALEAKLVVEVFFSPIPGTFGTVDSPLPEVTAKDEELISRLATTVSTQGVSPQPTILGPILGPRGKSNPFE